MEAKRCGGFRSFSFLIFQRHTAESCRYWEIAAEICQALVDYHKRHTFNLRHIAELLGFEALMYSSMSRATVRETMYYRVVRDDDESEKGTYMGF